MSFNILTGKELANPPRPVLFVSIAATDGDTVYYCTTADQGATSLTYGGNTYECRISDESIDAVQTMNPQGFDVIPSLSIGIADPDASIWKAHPALHGWRGGTMTLTFVLYDIVAQQYSTDAIQWTFLVDTAELMGPMLNVSATNLLNKQQIKIPTVLVQYRCPWSFPTTPAERQDGADNKDSPFYRCGYSPDATGSNAVGNYETGTTPFTSCELTREACKARGMFSTDSSSRDTFRFGGNTWVAPTTFTGTSFLTGTKLNTRNPGFNEPNQAVYGQPIPLVFGTQWVNAKVLQPANDPNSMRFEALVCLGDVGDSGIQKVLVNGVELPQNGSDVLFTWRYITTGSRTGAINNDAIFNGNGDPHGSVACIECVIPTQLANGGAAPSCRVLTTGAKVRKYAQIASATASGGEITFTLVGANTDLAGNPPFTVTVTGNSNPAFNGTFELSNWTFGPPGTFTTLGVTATGSGTGGYAYYDASSTNPVWNLAFVLHQTGIQYADLDIPTWYAAAQYCDTTITYTDLTGASASHARFKSSFAIENQITGAQAITMLRNAAGIILAPALEGGIGCYIEQTLADQQGSTVAGSNYNSGVSSVSADGSAATGYFAYLFAESSIMEDTLQITQTKIAETPNEYIIRFQDEDNGWQDDSLKQADTDAVALVANQEFPQVLEQLGIPNFDQGTRRINTLLAKAQQGNPLGKGGSLVFKFKTSFRAVHLAERPGYIVGLSWQKLGLYQQPFRILSAKPSIDGETWDIEMAWHNDAWYEDAANQVTTPLVNTQFRAASSGPPLPWKPNAVTTQSWDPIFAGAKTMQFQQSVSTLANGTPQNSVAIAGIRPVNQFSGIKSPLTPLTGTVVAGTGSLPSGTYLAAVAGIDSSGQYSTLSNLVTAVLSATGEFSIPTIYWDGSTSKYDLFVGTDPFSMVSKSGQTSGTPSSLTISTATTAGSSYGPPDPSFQRFRFRAKTIPVPGLLSTGSSAATQYAVQVASVSSNTINFTGTSLGTLTGRTLSIVSSTNTASPSVVYNDTIASNTSTSVTMTHTPTCVAGDWVQIRCQATAATSTTITDSALSLTTNAQAGNVVRIIGGTGAGQTAAIASNTATAITINGTWTTTPDTTSIFWIESPTWTYDFEASPITVGTLDASPVVIGSVPTANYYGQCVLIEVITEDQLGSYAPESYAPIRDIFVPGAGGTRTVTGSTTVTNSDGTINENASGGNITQALPAASSMPNQDLTFTKTDSSANTITITGAASGTVILSSQYQTVTFHSDGTNWTLLSKTGSPLTTKGDIYTYGTADTRQGVGADGTFITADSTQTVGWKWGNVPTVIGWYLNSGVTQTLYAPPAPRAGSVTVLKVLTIASDATTDFTFQITKNGTNILTSSQTIAHGTAANTLTTLSVLTSSPLSVAKDDKFALVISSGTSNWHATVQIET